MLHNSEEIRTQLKEVTDAAHWAGDLFEKSFGAKVPDFPKHFVLVAEAPNDETLILGYVHFTQHENVYLGGGMCVNKQALRQLPKNLRSALNQQGGVAYTMLSEAVKQLNDCDAVFGYVGHKGAYRIDLAVGFEPTVHKHLIVYWKKPMNELEQKQIIQKAHAYGPF
ncbi:hypothetical protein OS175_10505 [Marinicella sp. S1101]|uniref:hypothetical protein n=1 Tax=Marinicella marina TaxID=2996016 RepID=UPI002260D99D|nr:hypothetical protein [Marinicella marina]MCX7554311.1 hypothetical protein [Marinicella marina]MDJ1138698.1 hypothetical protein [Marinicella marina]